MKRYKIFCFLAAVVIFITSCETDVEDPAGDRGIASVPGVQDLNPATFDVNDLENTFIQFTLVLDDPEVSESVILASYKGDRSRTEIARVSEFPATVVIALSDVAAKLGLELNSIEAADVFNFEVQTIQGGRSYFSSAAFNAAVVCGYDPAMVTGSYRGVSASWEVDGGITITADPDDELIVYVSGLAALDGLDEDLGPLKMVINPLDFSVVAERTALASSAFGYTNIWYEGTGELNTCDGTYTMGFTIGVDQGTFGGAPHTFIFTKN